MMKDYSRHIISSASSVRDALVSLNRLSGEVMTLLVADDTGRLVGTLTDGDVRRAILKGVTVDDTVDRAMHTSFKSLSHDNIDVTRLRDFRRKGIALVPLLDGEGHIVDVIDTRETSTVLPVSAILMAGGKGERLRPLTLDCPKPLLKVGGRSIIDYNVEALARAGITDVTVMVNYLAGMLEQHFDREVCGIKARCVREDRFLGTIGAASLIDHTPGGDTLVMNSDLLTTISFEDMFILHKQQHADITIAAVPYNVSVPYAILSTDGPEVKALEEKPSYSYYANAGIYLMANDLLSSLPEGERTDAPDLIEKAIADGRKVVYYPIDGTWIDIGSPGDFSRAQELMKHHNNFNHNNFKR